MNPPERSTAEPIGPGGGVVELTGPDADRPPRSVELPADSEGDSPPPSRPRRGRFLIETLAIVAVAVLVAVVLRVFVVQTYYVPSGSMEPTIYPGDRIAVDKLSYHFHSIHTGDIVVFATPPAEVGKCAGPPVPDLVKRVIGLPGQRISSSGNAVLINGQPLSEPWLPYGQPLGKPITTQTVPAGEYFVMGDNRPNSCDSRYWGDVRRSLIVGKVVAIFWPLSRFHWF